MLLSNPDIIAICFALLAGYITFIVVWLVFFSKLFLTSGISGNTLWLVYYVVYFFWTSAIFKSMQRVFISGVAAHWYFYQSPDFNAVSWPALRPATAAWNRASRQLLGTVCLGSIMQSSSLGLRFGVRMIRRVSGKGRRYLSNASRVYLI